MENASKALIIAGAILISILIIGIGMAVIQATTGIQEEVGSSMDQRSLETYNSTYTAYVGMNKRGSDVRTLVNTIITNNATYEDYQISLDFLGTPYEADTISTVLKSIGNTKRYDIDVKMDKTGRVNQIIVTEAVKDNTTTPPTTPTTP